VSLPQALHIDPPLPFLVHPGQMVAGKYKIERTLATGGMGIIVLAQHEGLGQRYVIKVMRPESLSNEEAVTRFLQEARTAARLRSDHVARVFDVGQLDDGSPYMVMEYLEGQDLGKVLAEQGPLVVPSAVDYVLQALEALAEAHATGVIHRDFKPSNLVLIKGPGGAPRIKVLDFGISKNYGLDAPAAGAQLTATRQVVGSPAYISPEQMTTPRSVDARSDIWSAGVVLHELLSGDPPFQGETVGAIMAAILAKAPPPLRERRAEVPAGLEKVVRKCLEREPADRYADVAELARALAPFGSEWAEHLAERVQTALRPTDAPVTRAPSRPVLPEPPTVRRRRALRIAAILLGAVIVAAVALWLARLLGKTGETAAPLAPSADSAAPPSSAVVTAEPPSPPALADTAASAQPLGAAPPASPRESASPRGSASAPRKKSTREQVLGERQ
jgi:eukaryotic-like serine/threonine-protein kinase